jgi:hypothetical protein
MPNNPKWLEDALAHLASPPAPSDADAWGKRIAEVFAIAEVEKYATQESKFELIFKGATERDVATMRRYLSAKENAVLTILIG